MNLTRDLVYLDIETTSVNPNAHIIEFGAVKQSPGGLLDKFSFRCKPGVHISKEAFDVHGISDADVANESPFADFASTVLDYIEGCDLAGYNIHKFDIPILQNELRRAGKIVTLVENRNVIDMMVIYHKYEPRNFEAAYKKYVNAAGNPHKAHSALDDAIASQEVLLGQFKAYPDMPTDISELSALCTKPRPLNAVDKEGRLVMTDGVVCLNFGVHRGTPIDKVVPDYLKWMATGNFSDDVKAYAFAALKKNLDAVA